MKKADHEELEPLLKSKNEAEVTIPSNILLKVFCLFLLLFPGKNTKDKIDTYSFIGIYQFLKGFFTVPS